MRRSSIITRRTHSSSISRQAQLLPITSSNVLPPPHPSPGIRPIPKPTSGSEKVKEWVDIFDGPMRPAAFVSPPTTPGTPPSTSPIRDTDNGVSSIIFDGPARPRYIIPGAYVHPPSNRNEPGSPSTSPRRNSNNVSGKDISALLSRSSLPPPRVYDGPAFEWELQTKRV